jgi:hypothetical protein
MKKITSAQYKEGVASLMTFSKMLEESLKEVLPDVELRCESAFSWRGYQIQKYSRLKDSQYYCQIDFGMPNVLTFFEYYEMSHQPFRVELDLIKTGYFTLPYEAQKEMLIDFIRKSSNEAIKWNESRKRQEIVPERLQ